MSDDLEQNSYNIFTAEFAACPHQTYEAMKSGCPVSRNAINQGPILTRHEDVMWALRHPEIFSSQMDLHLAIGTVRPMIPQQIDPPAQTKYRRILDPRFSRRRMLEIQDDVRASANDLIDRFIDDGRCEFDEAFAIPLPCISFLSLMGLPLEELDLFLELKDNIIRPQESAADPADAPRIRAETGQRIYAYFEQMIADRRANPTDDMMGYLVEVELEGAKLTNEEILDISYLLLLGGLDTVTATLGCNIAYLASNPDQRQRLVTNPELIPAAVEELLRYETPVMQIPRVLKQDVSIAGVELKAGELVTLMIGASNVDEAAFENAGVVDFDRERNVHVAFGAGPHRCLGSHLARMELRVGMEEWHRRIPQYEIQAGETPRYTPGIREVRYLPLVWDATP